MTVIVLDHQTTAKLEKSIDDYDKGYKAACIQMEEILSAVKKLKKGARTSNVDFNAGFHNGWNDTLEGWRLRSKRQ